MDGTTAAIISAFSGAISVLFAALMLAMKQGREDWKDLWKQSDDDLKQHQREQAEVARKNADAMLQLSHTIDSQGKAIERVTSLVEQLPKRRDDYPETTQRGRS